MICISKISINELINYLLKSRLNSKKQYIIIDLDDTIFDTSLRRQISYCKIQKQFQLPKLQSIVFKNNYGISNILKKYRYEPESLEKINKKFLSVFLSPKLIPKDSIFPGVKKALDTFYNMGYILIYLTGRHSELYKPTLKSLIKHKIFYGPEHSKLVIKPDLSIDDLSFKKEFVLKFKHPNSIVCTIDNDSEICITYKKLLSPKSLVIRFNSVQKDSLVYPGPILNSWNPL
ncbi:MAG: HAD family hydrolase [Candidatus Helarchaeota archaeon]